MTEYEPTGPQLTQRLRDAMLTIRADLLGIDDQTDAATTLNASQEAAIDALEAAVAGIASQTANDARYVNEEQLDPTKTARIFDEFVGGLFTSGNIGDLGWKILGGTVFGEAAPQGRIGVVGRNTGAVANTYATMVPYANGGIGQVHPSDLFTWNWGIKLGVNGADADSLVRVGLALETPDPPNNGIYLLKPHDDPGWYGVCRSAGVETMSALVAPANTQWVKLSARRTASGVAFSVNGGAEVPVITNVPSSALLPFLGMKNRTAVDKFVTIDYFDYLVTELSR